MAKRPIVLVALDGDSDGPSDAGRDGIQRQLALATGDVLPKPAQRQRIDPGIVVRWRATKRLVVGRRRIVQRRGGVLCGGARVGLTLGMRVPHLGPFVLPGAREEALRLAVLVLLGEGTKHVARFGIALRAAKRPPFDLSHHDIVRVELARLLHDAQRVERPVHVGERLGRRAQRLEFQKAVGRLLGKHQDVARTLLLAGDLDAPLPAFQRLPEFVDVAHLEGFPVRLLQAGNLLVDRAGAPPAPGTEGGGDRFGEGLALRLERGRIELSLLQRVVLQALPGDVEGQAIADRVGHHRTAGAQRVAHADFVPHVRIVHREVGDNELRQEQILEHVEMDRAAAAIGVGPMRPQPGGHDRRLEQSLVDVVAIHFGSVRQLLLAERHDREGAACRAHETLLRSGYGKPSKS